MLLALKRTPASDATPTQIALADFTKWRLCSKYSHGGIVIGNQLLHSSFKDHGLTSEPFDVATASTGWDFYDLGSERDAYVLALFEQLKGTPYDLLGLAIFVYAGKNAGDAKRLYCFEWCALAMGLPVNGRVTPEMLLRAALDKKGEQLCTQKTTANKWAT